MPEKPSGAADENQEISLSAINQKRLEILKEFFYLHPDQPAFDDEAVMRYLNEFSDPLKELKKSYPFFEHILNFANVSFFKFFADSEMIVPCSEIACPLNDDDEEIYTRWIDQNDAYFADDLAIFRSYTLLLKTLRPDYAMIAKEVLKKHLITDYQSSDIPFPPEWLLGLPAQITEMLEKNLPPPQTKDFSLKVNLSSLLSGTKTELQNVFNRDPFEEMEQKVRFAEAFKDLDKLVEQLIVGFSGL